VKKLYETNPLFHDILKGLEQGPKYRNTPLTGFLIKPVQRIFKYPLLFKELAKCLQYEQSLASVINKTIDCIEAILTTINEAKRAEEQKKALQRVVNDLYKIGIWDIDVRPKRVFLKEGYIGAVDATSLRAPKTFKNSKTWKYLLFNDVIICFRKSLRKTSKLIIPLGEAIVLDLSDNTFQVIHIGIKIWIFVANTPTEKKELFESLENNIRKLSSGVEENKHVSQSKQPAAKPIENSSQIKATTITTTTVDHKPPITPTPANSAEDENAKLIANNLIDNPAVPDQSLSKKVVEEGQEPFN